MTSSSAALFLNLDLEVDATFDLESLAKHFEGRAFVLFSGPIESRFRLTLEPLVNGTLNSDPVACTEHFLRILEALPKDLMDAWTSCTSRVLDYGFDGGLESPPLHVTLPASMLARTAKLGLALRITVYPFRDSTLKEE